jgi:hypothetical protein
MTLAAGLHMTVAVLRQLPCQQLKQGVQGKLRGERREKDTLRASAQMAFCEARH